MWRILFVLHIAMAMLIPEDTEMLDGYAPISFPEISPEDDYYEARSLSAGSLYKSIRDKRAANEHKTHESDGLISHFRPNTVNDFTKIESHKGEFQPVHPNSFRGLKIWLKNKFPRPEEEEFHRRKRRNADAKEKKSNDGSTNEEKKHPTTATKLIKTSNGFVSRDTPSAAALVGSKWIRSPFEYSKVQHEEDSMAIDTSSSSVNEGMKSRTPRVNFVTQQKKSMDHDEAKSASVTKSEFYKSPPLLHNSKETAAATSTNSERYPDRSGTIKPSTYDYKDREMNVNRYDELVENL